MSPAVALIVLFAENNKVSRVMKITLNVRDLSISLILEQTHMPTVLIKNTAKMLLVLDMGIYVEDIE
jgi:hypothetical protein